MSTKWLQLLQNLAPIILGTVNPALIPIAGIVTHAIQAAENSGKTGKEKAAAVVTITNDAVSAINAAHSATGAAGNLIDGAAVQSALQSGIDTTIQVVNLLDKKGN
jgi:hypothetical protein